MPLEWLFGRKMTPDEMLRKNQRALNKVMHTKYDIDLFNFVLCIKDVKKIE